MKKLTIKRVGALSAAKISGVLGVVIGLFVGALYALIFGVLGVSMMGGGEEEGAGFLAIAAGSMCLLPVLYGTASFIMGALYAFVFNLVVGIIGGLEIEVEENAGSLAA